MNYTSLKVKASTLLRVLPLLLALQPSNQARSLWSSLSLRLWLTLTERERERERARGRSVSEEERLCFEWRHLSHDVTLTYQHTILCMWRQSPINALFDFLLSDRAHKQTRIAAPHLQNSHQHRDTRHTPLKVAEFLRFLSDFLSTFHILFQ